MYAKKRKGGLSLAWWDERVQWETFALHKFLSTVQSEKGFFDGEVLGPTKTNSDLQTIERGRCHVCPQNYS